MTERTLFKDDVLGDLAEESNVAQFVSFSPELEHRHIRVKSESANFLAANLDPVDNVRYAVEKLLERVDSVNVRAFTPEKPDGNPFVYGLTDLDEVVDKVLELADGGFYTIVNETIDVNDGGVSGVVLGDSIEFAPNDTPRCVEKPGCLSTEKTFGCTLLDTVYGFVPDLFGFEPTDRVEFSIHPNKVGLREDHTIIWQVESVDFESSVGELSWPNNFSRHVGDKAFGLLVADALGLRVPLTDVIGRNVAPFFYGVPCGSERWIRTCPVEPVPGLYTTQKGWIDPFALMNREDPEGDQIASVLSQFGIPAAYSGAAAYVSEDELPIVEGVKGEGEGFMQGSDVKTLPLWIRDEVSQFVSDLSRKIGPCRIEWVMDSNSTIWVVQLHRGRIASSGTTIVPGNPMGYGSFDVEDGLEALRDHLDTLPENGSVGVELVGEVGVLSHMGDLLRRHRIPSRVVPS